MFLFVYGTLKSGWWNHRFLANAKFIGNAVLPNYRMFDLGAFPGIDFVDNSQSVVRGELYEITPEMLPSLDRLEGVDSNDPTSFRGLYRRITEVIFLDNEAGDEAIDAYVYVYNGPSAALKTIEDGTWR